MTQGLSPETNQNNGQSNIENAQTLSRRDSKISIIDEVFMIAKPQTTATNDSSQPVVNELYPKIKLDRTSSFASQTSINNNNKNGTLQLLVIPKKILEEEQEDQHSEINGTLTYRRKLNRQTSHAGSHIDNRLSYLRPASFNRASSHVASAGGHSNNSHHTDAEHHVSPPTSAEEKSKTTRSFLATVSAISYAILIIVFALILFISSGLTDLYPIPELYGIILIAISSAYLIYLLVDIRIHVRNAKKTVKDREQLVQFHENQQSAKIAAIENGTALPESFNFMPYPSFNGKPISHRYCFVTGRHGEMLYLKIGAAWFCLGLLIHSILLISYQLIFLTSTDPQFAECASIWSLVFEACFASHALLILFFIFKYMNVIINECRGLARFAFMHIFGTVLAFWVFTIVRETTDLIALSKLNNYKTFNQSVIITPKSWTSDIDDFEPHSEICPGADDMNTILRTFSPYLYPFIIEFFIYVAGIFYMVWSHVNKCAKKAAEVEAKKSLDPKNHRTTHAQTELPKITEFDQCDNRYEHDTNYKSNIFVYADCHAANRGLFAGLMLLVVTIVFIILFFVATGVDDDDYFRIGVLMNGIFELVVMVGLIVAAIIGYIQTTRLDVNPHPVSVLDDFLLFIGIPAFFSETIFSFVPAITNGSVVNILMISAQILQVLIQTPWIIDSMRRCANSVENRKRKPGREVVTFMIIANVTLWIFYAFSVKNRYTGDERYDFYGYTIWTILNHLSLPLIMFYRFHSSVCLVDIWKHAYEPGAGH